MKNAGVVGVTMAWVNLSGLADGFNGVDGMGFDGVDGAVGGLVASMGGVDGWLRWVASMVDWGLRHRGH